MVRSARSVGDSWDLASSVGSTATMVAAARAVASREPDRLIDDPYAAPLVRAVGIDFFTKVADGEITFGDGDDSGAARLMTDVMAVRTRFFDDFFVESGQAGIRQAVILAAGLGSRPYRLSWPAGTVVYEIDQPAVIEFKSATMAELGAQPTVAIDLRDDWPKALRDSGFDPTQPTAWSAEGLLIYLPPDAQDRLLDNITALSAAGSRIATEHMSTSTLTSDWADKLSERSRQMGSTIDLAELFYAGDRNTAGDYLSRHGWQTNVLLTEDAYAAQGFALPDNEWTALAVDSGYLTAVLGQEA